MTTNGTNESQFRVYIYLKSVLMHEGIKSF